MADDWLLNLKAACEAGYYRTESAETEQETFPWQNKLCRDCPFWINDICQVDLGRCNGYRETCAYFDPPGYSAARAEILQRLERTWGAHRQDRSPGSDPPPHPRPQ
jgi:hypothetical protein